MFGAILVKFKLEFLSDKSTQIQFKSLYSDIIFSVRDMIYLLKNIFYLIGKFLTKSPIILNEFEFEFNLIIINVS